MDSVRSLRREGELHGDFRDKRYSVCFCTLAVELAQRLLAIAKHSDAYRNRGRSCDEMGEHDKAKADFTKALKLGHTQ